jgi:hypothetical protein
MSLSVPGFEYTLPVPWDEKALAPGEAWVWWTRPPKLDRLCGPGEGDYLAQNVSPLGSPSVQVTTNDLERVKGGIQIQLAALFKAQLGGSSKIASSSTATIRTQRLLNTGDAVNGAKLSKFCQRNAQPLRSAHSSLRSYLFITEVAVAEYSVTLELEREVDTSLDVAAVAKSYSTSASVEFASSSRKQFTVRGHGIVAYNADKNVLSGQPSPLP